MPAIQKKCATCGGTWITRKAAARTCSPKCRAVLREQEKPSRGRAPREYPERIAARVRELYAGGATVKEIGQIIGPGYRVQTLIERYVEKRRRAIPRDQTGPKNGTWKGDKASYDAFHERVKRRRGKPSNCTRCGTTDPAQSYEWANLTGRYEDVFDYARMCVPCHRDFDFKGRRPNGQFVSLEEVAS